MDDSTILDSHELWRRVRPDWIVLDKNLTPPGYRPSSAAFQNYPGTDKMSVLLGEDHKDPAGAVGGTFVTYSLAAVTAGKVRELKQIVERAPEPDEPAHAHVTGKKTGSVKSNLGKAATWKVLRPAVDPAVPSSGSEGSTEGDSSPTAV